MKPENKEKIRLTVREILLTFCDGMTKIEEIFGYPWQRREAREYWKWRELDKNRFYKSLWRLEKQGYIKRYQKEKGQSIKLTPIGEKKAIKYITNELKTKQPKIWNKKWHMVIFDVPEDKKTIRNIIRDRLKIWGFYQLQKSVFIHPFDHQKEVAALKYLYDASPYLQYCIVDDIDASLDLVDLFYQKQILIKTS